MLKGTLRDISDQNLIKIGTVSPIIIKKIFEEFYWKREFVSWLKKFQKPFSYTALRRIEVQFCMFVRNSVDIQRIL